MQAMQKNKTTFKKVMTTEIHKLPWRVNLWIILAIIGVFAIVDLVLPGGQIRYYAKWAECGRKPIERRVTSWYFGTGYYSDSLAINPMRVGGEYYCTPLEAERAGLSASADEIIFPHLKAENERKDAH